MNPQTDPDFWWKLCLSWELVAQERLRQVEEYKSLMKQWKERAQRAEALLEQALPKEW